MAWRSADGKYRLIDNNLYMKATEAGKPIWVCLTDNLGAVEIILLRLLCEATDEED